MDRITRTSIISNSMGLPYKKKENGNSSKDNKKEEKSFSEVLKKAERKLDKRM